jgi:hypothetical protein
MALFMKHKAVRSSCRSAGRTARLLLAHTAHSLAMEGRLLDLRQLLHEPQRLTGSRRIVSIIHHRRVLRSAKWHLTGSERSALLDILDSCPCTHGPIERGKDLACASEPKCPADCAPCFRPASLRQSKPQRPALRLGLHKSPIPRPTLDGAT